VHPPVVAVLRLRLTAVEHNVAEVLLACDTLLLPALVARFAFEAVRHLATCWARDTIGPVIRPNARSALPLTAPSLDVYTADRLVVAAFALPVGLVCTGRCLFMTNCAIRRALRGLAFARLKPVLPIG